MREPIHLLLVWSALVGACKSGGAATDPGDSGGGPPVTTDLTCSQPGGQSAECGLALPSTGGSPRRWSARPATPRATHWR